MAELPRDSGIGVGRDADETAEEGDFAHDDTVVGEEEEEEDEEHLYHEPDEQRMGDTPEAARLRALEEQLATLQTEARDAERQRREQQDRLDTVTRERDAALRDLTQANTNSTIAWKLCHKTSKFALGPPSGRATSVA